MRPLLAPCSALQVRSGTIASDIRGAARRNRRCANRAPGEAAPAAPRPGRAPGGCPVPSGVLRTSFEACAGQLRRGAQVRGHAEAPSCSLRVLRHAVAVPHAAM